MAPPPVEDNLAHTLLSRAHSPDSAQRIYSEKILHRPLHLKPSHPTPAPNAQLQRRAARLKRLSDRQKKLKPKPLSSRQKRALCLYDIPPSAQRYEIYVPLHNMWLGYIREVLGIDERGNGADGREVQIGSAMAAKLCSADYHGAEVEVVRSRCVSRVGVRGIVVKDSKFVFEVVTRRDQVKVVPKEHTIFRFVVPRPGKERKANDDASEMGGEKTKDGNENEEEVEKVEEKLDDKAKQEGRRDLIFELHGDQFIYRAADRTNKKFKTHFLPDL
jgi:ribonuclease P protein subunit POP4